METASRVMYSIANFFTWIVVLASGVLIVMSILAMTGVIPNYDALNGRTLVYYIVLMIVSLFTIMLVRIAKNRHSSKAWDVLFIVLGVLGANIFYILGGIFGVIAIRR